MVMYEYGAICKAKFLSCIEDIEEHPSQEKRIVESCANYIQHMVDDATNTALANFLLKCYDYEYDKILNDLMKLTISGQAGECVEEPRMCDIIGGINFALNSDISGLVKFLRSMQKDAEAELPFI